MVQTALKRSDTHYVTGLPSIDPFDRSGRSFFSSLREFDSLETPPFPSDYYMDLIVLFK